MYYLESHLIGMQEFFRALLQRQQFVGAQVAFVVRSSLAGQNRFSQIIHVGVAACWLWCVPSCRVAGPLGIFFRGNDFAITHMNDAIAITGGLGVVGDHEHGLAKVLVG